MSRIYPVNWFIHHHKMTYVMRVLWFLKRNPRSSHEKIGEMTKLSGDDLAATMAYGVHFGWIYPGTYWYTLTSTGKQKCYFDPLGE